MILTAPFRGLTLILLANSSGLARPFSLEAGDVTVSTVRAPVSGNLRALNGRWRITGAVVLAAVLLSAPSQRVAGERQIRPFVGTTFGGMHDLSTPRTLRCEGSRARRGERGVAAGNRRRSTSIGARDTGSFQAGDRRLVLDSRVTTLMGNVVVAAPARENPVRVRPYLSGGAGLMWTHIG
jgi:uncharacterized membrane protein (UPF0136 family)